MASFELTGSTIRTVSSGKDLVLEPIPDPRLDILATSQN